MERRPIPWPALKSWSAAADSHNMKSLSSILLSHAPGRGFTLVELMIVLAVAAILLSIAVPSFRTTIQNNRLITEANDFVTALHLARSEAIKRRARVTLCKSTDGAVCTATGGWEQGWIAFVDSNNNNSRDAGEEIVRVHGAADGAITARGNAGVADNFISYLASGMTTLPDPGTLVLCDTRGFGDFARSVQIAIAGRVSARSATAAGAGSCTP